MSRKKLILTIIVCAIISAGCCFFNIFFPIISIALMYFCMRNMLKTILTTNDVQAYLQYKWMWIGIFAAPYPIMLIFGLTLPMTEPYDWKNYTTVLVLFSIYTLLAIAFGEQISRAILKKASGAAA